MITLTTQKDARAVRKLTFCYICGNPIEETESINHDHIPPASAFDSLDRNFPLKLPVHKEKCHSPMNLGDEVMGQLISLIHNKRPSEANDKLKGGIKRGDKCESISQLLVTAPFTNIKPGCICCRIEQH